MADDPDDGAPVAPATRAEVIDQLTGAGFFDRHIIGREPENLTDAELADLVDELARRSFVAEATGKDVRDVVDTDFADVVREAGTAAVEQSITTPLGSLSDLGRLVAEADFRDPTGVRSPAYDQLLEDIATGNPDSPFLDHGGRTGTSDPGGTGGGDGTGSSSGLPGPSEPSEPSDRSGPPTGSGADDAPAGGGPGTVGETPPPTGSLGGDPPSAGGDPVPTVFETTFFQDPETGTPSGGDVGAGSAEFVRGADGTWYDAAGNAVTDPGTVENLEAQYTSYRDQGGTDTQGTIVPTGRTHEEAGDPPPDDPPPDDPPPDDPDDPDDAVPPGGDPDDPDDPDVEFTPDPDAPVLPPRSELTFPGFRPKDGTVDPVEDEGLNSGPVDTSVRLPGQLDLVGNPGSPDPGLDFGAGAGGVRPIGDPFAPDGRVINYGPDGDFGAGARGPEDDPFDTGPQIDLLDPPGSAADPHDGGAGGVGDVSFEIVDDRPRIDDDDLRLVRDPGVGREDGGQDAGRGGTDDADGTDGTDDTAGVGG